VSQKNAIRIKNTCVFHGPSMGWRKLPPNHDWLVKECNWLGKKRTNGVYAAKVLRRLASGWEVVSGRDFAFPVAAAGFTALLFCFALPGPISTAAVLGSSMFGFARAKGHEITFSE